MAQDYFRVERGFADDNIVYISGTGAPIAVSGETRDAPIGTHYTDYELGHVYVKTGNLGATSDWERLLDQSDYDVLSELVGGGVQNVIDELNTVEDAVGLASDGTFVKPSDSNYLSTATSVKDALGKLDSQIKTVSDDLSEEASVRAAADAAEIVARNEAIAAASATAASQLATETQARLDGDTALTSSIAAVQDEVDRVELAVGLNTDGTYTAPTGTYVGAATTLKDAVVALDTALTSEAATRLAADAALQSALDNEAQLRQDGDAALQTQIQDWVNTQIALDNTTDEARVAAEAALRIAKDEALQAELDRVEAAVGLATDGNIIPITGTNYLNGVTTVFGGAFALDTQIKTVADGLATEVADRQAADLAINTAITNEIQNRTAADTAMQNELNATQAGAGLESDGSYAAPAGSTYLGSATSLKDADSKLDVAIKTLSDTIDSIQGGDLTQLVSDLAAEKAAREAADLAEKAAREAADTALQSNISNESIARINSDNAINAMLEKARVEAYQTGVTNGVIDSVAADTTLAAKWIVYVKGSNADEGKVSAFEIFALSDANGNTATTVDYTVYAKLRIGGLIDGLDASVVIENGNIVLKVAATNPVNVRSIREIVQHEVN